MRLSFIALLPFYSVLTMCHPSLETLATHSGPEDLTVFTEGPHRLLVTGTAPRGILSRKGASRLETLDLHSPEATFQEAYLSEGKSKFQPVGLDSIPDPRKPKRSLLFVVNNISKPSRRGQIDVFRYNGSEFQKEFSIDQKSDFLPMPNGITVASDGTIYVSNMKILCAPKNRISAGPPSQTETQTNFHNTIVAIRPKQFGGDDRWRVVAHDLDGGNGLALSSDEKHLLVASYYRKTIHAFARDPKTGLLSEARKVKKFPFFVDNLKAIGPDHYTICGQRSSFFSVGLHLFLKTPTASGAAIEFRWTPEGGFQRIQDYSPLLRHDRQAPSTLLIEGAHGYVGHIITRGVRRFSIEP